MYSSSDWKKKVSYLKIVKHKLDVCNKLHFYSLKYINFSLPLFAEIRTFGDHATLFAINICCSLGLASILQSQTKFISMLIRCYLQKSLLQVFPRTSRSYLRLFEPLSAMSSTGLSLPHRSVTIIGAGLGGLTLALALRKCGITSRLFELRTPDY